MSRDAAASPLRAAAPSGTSDYAICGWLVRSAVPLPEAMPWTGDDRTPDVTIRFGLAPALLNLVRTAGAVQVDQGGACHLEFEGIGRFLAIAGREVIVEPRGNLDAPEFHAILLGPVLGIMCHQCRMFPLYASCIRIANS